MGPYQHQLLLGTVGSDPQVPGADDTSRIARPQERKVPSSQWAREADQLRRPEHHLHRHNKPQMHLHHPSCNHKNCPNRVSIHAQALWKVDCTTQPLHNTHRDSHFYRSSHQDGLCSENWYSVFSTFCQCCYTYSRPGLYLDMVLETHQDGDLGGYLEDRRKGLALVSENFVTDSEKSLAGAAGSKSSVIRATCVSL